MDVWVRKDYVAIEQDKICLRMLPDCHLQLLLLIFFFPPFGFLFPTILFLDPKF
jgi:hypothetical protein